MRGLRLLNLPEAAFERRWSRRWSPRLGSLERGIRGCLEAAGSDRPAVIS